MGDSGELVLVPDLRGGAGGALHPGRVGLGGGERASVVLEDNDVCGNLSCIKGGKKTDREKGRGEEGKGGVHSIA